MDYTILTRFRPQAFASFLCAGGAVFNICNVLLCETQVRTLPELSLLLSFECPWPSIYKALEDGFIDNKRLRHAAVQALLHDRWPYKTLWISVDRSSITSLEGSTSEDWSINYMSNLLHTVELVSVSWQFSTVILLSYISSSWIGILDQKRISTTQTALVVASMQLRVLVPLLKRSVILVADRSYATLKFLSACSDCSELGCRVIICLNRNRMLYCVPVWKHAYGVPSNDGLLFQGSRAETQGQPNEQWIDYQQDKPITMSRWEGLHLREARQVSLYLVQVQGDHTKDTKRDHRESWFVLLDEHILLSLGAGIYGRHFSHEHGYRFLKQQLLWTKDHVSTSKQYERGSVLIAVAQKQLVLTHELENAMVRSWERSCERPVISQQVRHGTSTILSQIGTPARVCKPHRKSPELAKGFHPQSVKRFKEIYASE